MRAALVAGVLLALTGCGSLGRPVQRTEGIGLPVSEGFVRTSDGTQLFYRVAGAGPDTVVAIHGGPGMHMWSLVNFDALAAGGTVIYYDQRGGGRSALPNYPSQVTAALHVSDLDAVLRHFRIERATLLGHSWGGLLAGMYAAQYPARVSRLILVAPMFVRSEPHARSYAASLPSLLRGDTTRFRTLYAAFDTSSAPHTVCMRLAPILARAGGTRDTSAVQRLTNGICTPAVHPDAMRHGWTRTPEWTMRSLPSWDLREQLRGVTAETLVIAGERDAIPIAATQEWVSSIRRAGLSVIARAGHYLFADDPVAFARAVREFLGRD